jgi:hypothetical protein
MWQRLVTESEQFATQLIAPVFEFMVIFDGPLTIS